MLPIFNIFRLFFAALLLAPVYFIAKERSIFIFLRFAGPSFVKLGQLLSTRPDLVGSKIANSLAKFQDDLGPFCEHELKKILQSEFGYDANCQKPSSNQNFNINFAKIFAEFDYHPTASASIAQVHKAKLVSGELVAVKILRPRINQIVARDIATVVLVAAVAKIFSKFLGKFFAEIATLLKYTAKYELDLLREAANGSQLKENLREVKGFYVPKIFWQYSSRKVLVLEWIDGLKFSDIAAIKNSNANLGEISRNLAISYFHQVYVDGFFHADMHPGNLFLMKNGDIAAVDFGIIGKIDRKTRLAVAEILIGFLQRDYQKVAKIHIEAGFVSPQTNLIDLALSCRIIGETIVGLDVKNISFAKLLSNIIDMTFEHQMEVKADLFLLQKTLLLVEGVGVSLNPDLNMWDLARPWIKNWAKQHLGIDYKMLDIVRDLLAKAKKFLE